MNYGRFFRLNNAKSDLSRGIAFYDYIWLQDKDCVKNGTPEYPVYLTVSHDSIDFHVHYHNDYTDNEGNHIHKHLHNAILTLPLSANIEIKDGLTEALVESWNTNFPEYDNGQCNYLYNLLENAILNDKDNGLCYTDLPIFNNEPRQQSIIKEAKEKIKKNDYYVHREYYAYLKKILNEWNRAIERVNNIYNTDFKYYQGQYPEPYRFNKFIRILILDFLFDLEQTKVFQTSPHYEHISIKLKENFFFNALANKAKYYYYRKIEPSIEPSQENKNFFLENYFLLAEEQWIKSIMDPRSDHNFTLEKGWFDNPEEEMVKVYAGINGVTLCDKIDKTNQTTQRKVSIERFIDKIKWKKK